MPGHNCTIRYNNCFVLLLFILAMITSAFREDVNSFNPSEKEALSFSHPSSALGGGKTTTGNADAKTIAAGGYHSCAVTDSGNVVCWGKNDHGQLGNGTKTNSRVPVTVKLSASGASLTNAIAVTAGLNHTCALTSNAGTNQVLCWGANDHGQLGDGSITERVYPVAVTIDGVINVIAGGNHTCVIYDTPSSTSGRITCWGENGSGQLGRGDNVEIHAPSTAITGLNNVAALCTNQSSTCAQNAGSASCWGNGDAYALTPSVTNVNTPTAINGITASVTKLACGVDHVCAVMGDELNAICWGKNNDKQLGVNAVGAEQQCVGNTNCAKTALNVINAETGGILTNIQNVSAGSSYSCALTNDTRVKCWGRNNLGQLGNGTAVTPLYQADYVFIAIATPPTILQGVFELATGLQHACAMRSNGNIYCWGDNTYGQLGDGTLIGKFYATPVTGFDIRQYLVSGRVTDSGGFSGVSGVTISDGASLTTVTDDNGAYSFTIDSQGAYDQTHRLTPVKSGSGFDPAYRDVVVNDANNPNQNRSFQENTTGCVVVATAYAGTGSNPTPDKTKSAGCSTSGEYVAGELITFTPHPGTGQQLKDWSGTDAADSAVLTVSNTTTVTANYEAAPCYALSVAANPLGKAVIALNPLNSPSCSNASYNAGTVITMKVTPKPYYHLDHWSAYVNAATNRMTMPVGDTAVTGFFDMYLRKGTYDDATTSIVHSSTWLTQNNASYYGGAQHYTKTRGANMVFYFNGRQLKLYYTAGKTYGKLSVQIDSRAPVILNEYAAATAYKRLWTSALLTNGNHKVTLLHSTLNALTVSTNLDGIIIP